MYSNEAQLNLFMNSYGGEVRSTQVHYVADSSLMCSKRDNRKETLWRRTKISNVIFANIAIDFLFQVFGVHNFFYHVLSRSQQMVSCRHSKLHSLDVVSP